MKYFYGFLCLLGTALPYGAFVPWIFERGFNVVLLFDEASSSKISSFAWLDVVVSAVVLLGFIGVESKRIQLKNWWLPVVGTLTVGVSLGLPLFLLLRELHLEKQQVRPTQ
ncbi:MAG: DUF2834 domain-containing protein [Lyngbya sp.]|nr:DUF2834 domain-containing protein [Lyngbya sp.]